MFEFKILHRNKKSRARTGELTTPHGTLHTPNLAIVGTEGAIKAVPTNEIPHTPIEYSIVNTFHIFVKDILPKIKEAGGIHAYMNYPNVCASDSGGFQVFSLGFGKTHGVNKLGAIFPGTEGEESDENNPLIITENDVTFSFDGKEIILNPEISMDIQHDIGADIIFAFDECTSALNSKEYTAESMERTHRWLDRCITHHAPHAEKQALFGIVQGGNYQDLRELAAQVLATKDVPGFGIGGSLGKTKEDMHNILGWVIPLLPDEKPRHLLGIGHVRDIFEGVERGIDLFDCVIPTREARHKILYTDKGKVAVRKLKHIDEVIDTDETSLAFKDGITFKQLAGWFTERDPRAYYYATMNNIQFFNRLLRKIRESIEKDEFFALKNEVYKHYL